MDPVEQSFLSSPNFLFMDRQIKTMEMEVQDNKKEIESLNQVIETMQNTRKEYEDSCAAATEQALSELKTMLSKRDNENARLREQRDQQLSELNERRQKETVKLASVNEFKSLAESRGARLFHSPTDIVLTFMPSLGTNQRARIRAYATQVPSGGRRR